MKSNLARGTFVKRLIHTTRPKAPNNYNCFLFSNNKKNLIDFPIHTINCK